MSATDRVTRVAADLLDAAEAEARANSRSTKQQLDHWARVGQAVCAHQTAARRRVEAVLAGTLPQSVLTTEEHTVLRAEIDAGIQRSLAANDYAALPTVIATTHVALDADGNLIEHRPDGSIRRLGG
jgi:hypothetical protein